MLELVIHVGLAGEKALGQQLQVEILAQVGVNVGDELVYQGYGVLILKGGIFLLRNIGAVKLQQDGGKAGVHYQRLLLVRHRLKLRRKHMHAGTNQFPVQHLRRVEIALPRRPVGEGFGQLVIRVNIVKHRRRKFDVNPFVRAIGIDLQTMHLSCPDEEDTPGIDIVKIGFDREFSTARDKIAEFMHIVHIQRKILIVRDVVPLVVNIVAIRDMPKKQRHTPFPPPAFYLQNQNEKSSRPYDCTIGRPYSRPKIRKENSFSAFCSIYYTSKFLDLQYAFIYLHDYKLYLQ